MMTIIPFHIPRPGLVRLLVWSTLCLLAYTEDQSAVGSEITKGWLEVITTYFTRNFVPRSERRKVVAYQATLIVSLRTRTAFLDCN